MPSTNIPALIRQMMEPGFYPHSVTEPIELIQTHISYVLLTGNYAYKVKKPVNFDFLNFSTLSARQHFCQEELRLNQGNAPEIYLEVLPITKTSNQFALNGVGETVEYALKMKQFSQAELLLNLLEQGKLTTVHMEELGHILAQFHAQAHRNYYISTFGAISQIKLAFEDNYQQTKKYINGVQTQQQYEETKQFTDDFFAQQQDLLALRQKKGCIREGHGDLHLGNICLWQNKILLFDRIEFNESFRFVDVMYDVAFTVMDLQARGRKDLSYAFLNVYIEQTGDWEGLEILPLYLSRQAYVRAKVNSFLLDESDVTPEAQAKANQDAVHYYHLAWQYTRSHDGKLILMSGLSGSGKTTVARYLAQQLGAIQIRSDAVRKHLAGIPLEQSGGKKLYTAPMSQNTYQRLLELGTKLASRGFKVILDAKYNKQKLRGEVIKQAQRYQIPLEIIYCSAPESVLRDRLLKRTGDISDATADLLTVQQAAAEPFTELESKLVTTVDTSQDWQEQWVSEKMCGKKK